MSKEAMQLALEALEKVITAFGSGLTLQQNAITALRKALETEQEPVLWLKTWSDGSVSVLKTKSHAFADHELEPLYAAPPKQWVGLTDEEKEKLVETFYGTDIQRLEAVEAKLKEKNT